MSTVFSSNSETLASTDTIFRSLVEPVPSTCSTTEASIDDELPTTGSSALVLQKSVILRLYSEI